MAPNKKKYSNYLRNLVIQHYWYADSQREIGAKTLLLRITVQHMVEKYRSTKSVGNLFGHGRKRKTAATTGRLIHLKTNESHRQQRRLRSEMN